MDRILRIAPLFLAQGELSWGKRGNRQARGNITRGAREKMLLRDACPCI